MATTLKLRRGTTAAHSTFTGAAGEVTVDTDKDVIVVHDGSTAGGFPLLGATKPQVLSVNSASNALRITQTGTGNALVVEDDTNPDSTQFVVNTDGRVITGATQAYTNYLDGFAGTARNPTVQFNGTSLSTASSSLTNWANADSPPLLVLAKSKSGTVGTMTSTFSVGDAAGAIQFSASDNTNFIPTALIEAQIDGTPGTNDMPGRLVFSTTANGVGIPTERMRIDSSGNVGIGCIAEAGYILDIANPATASGSKSLVRISSSASAGDADAELMLDAKGTGEATLRLREDGVDRAAVYSAGDTDNFISSNILTSADLLLNGATTTINDTYSLRYSRPTGLAPVTGITGTITSSANTSTITGLSTTTGLVVGMVLTKTAGTGVLGTQACIQSIDSASQITVTNGFAAMTAGSITFTATPSPTTITAHSESSGTWAVDQDFARFAFSNSDGSGAGDGGIKASINAYSYDTAGTGAGMDFYVSSDGTTLTKAMRIAQNGDVLVAKSTANSGATVGMEFQSSGTTYSTASGATVLVINRLASDGTLVSFQQAGTTEGSISVSGTTVSYNGGHLSRWAQMLGTKDESLVKGTVMSNLDEMNEYYDADGNPVPNEQLNKVKVSDIEGDANVAGVFVNWTHDDAHNVDEINMAMTGDMIIRIAQGVTVQKGELLMSAGDGTAKPQGDDIVRAKTVAKVTSNHVTCTYADGSYCVPCVLMAC